MCAMFTYLTSQEGHMPILSRKHLYHSGKYFLETHQFLLSHI